MNSIKTIRELKFTNTLQLRINSIKFVIIKNYLHFLASILTFIN